MTKNSRLFETAFDRYAPRYAPEPKKSPIDYSNPTVCPYCKEPMILSKILTALGEESVYLCRSDRAVGVVPDVSTNVVTSENVDVGDPASTTTVNPTSKLEPNDIQPFGPGTEVSFVDSDQGLQGKVVSYVKSSLSVPDFYVVMCSGRTKLIKAALVSKV